MREAEDVLPYALGLKEGQAPFPWQEDLLARFQRGEIPEALDIPTGLGKTSVMAIWLVARSRGANVPRRLVYVVDRRAVVDQATDEAMRLREIVETNGDLKNRLGLRADQSLAISTLRGQYVDNREWLEDPAAPAIVVGTVDMVGSRLLFQGYGVSRKMRAYHAALLGVDTLVVLDEAHLVPPFEHLLRAIATDQAFRPRGKQRDQFVPPLRLVALSATGRRGGGEVVGLTARDYQHAEARKRLNAKKSLRIEPLNAETKLEEALARWAWEVTDSGKSPARVLVYSDSREVAQKAKDVVEQLQRRAGIRSVDNTELLVGGRRVFEREEARERLRSLGFIAGSKVARQYPVFLFATSAGEVGVDLDADHMVCDLVAWERMVQRLGRVNRRGEPEGHVATVVVIPEREPKNIDELFAKGADKLTSKEQEILERVKRLRATECVLKQLPVDGAGFSASPASIFDLKVRAATDATLRQVLQEATTPEPLRPPLTRPLVEAWALTSLKEHPGRPEVQPWLRGWIDDEPQTAVVWRTYLPVRTGGRAPRKKEIEDFFEAAPLHASEVLEAETFRVVKWIFGRVERLYREQAREGEAGNRLSTGRDEAVAIVLDRDGGLRKTLNLRQLHAAADGQGKEVEDLLVGAVVVVDARLGGLRAGLLDVNETDAPGTADGGDWLGEGVVGFRVRSTDTATPMRDRNWHERCRFAVEISEEGEATRWLVVQKWRENAATEEDRSADNPQLLDNHQAQVVQRASSLARAFNLGAEHVRVLTTSAQLHDEGKRASRWQRAFHAPRDGVYAKTAGPINYDLLDGYRHELGSLLRIEQGDDLATFSEEQRDLVLHLIAAHHGFARPLIGTTGCDEAPPSILDAKAMEIALRFVRLMDSWGPWGLAWWEALLRAADQQASKENSAQSDAEGVA